LERANTKWIASKFLNKPKPKRTHPCKQTAYMVRLKNETRARMKLEAQQKRIKIEFSEHSYNK